MKSFLNNLKILGPVIGALLMLGCTEDPGSPTGDQVRPPVATAEIGSRGGTLAASDFQLSVPDGAFAEMTTLDLYQEPGEESFHTSDPSPIWRVAGLPKNYREELTIRIRQMDPAPTGTLMAVGEEVHVRSLAALRRGWHLHETTSEADWSVLLLPSLATEPGDQSGESGQLDLWFTLTKGLSTHLTAAGHFRIRHREDLMSGQQASELGLYLEEAHDRLRELGFDLSRRTRWPVDVTMTLFQSDPASRPGIAADSHLGDDYGWLEFDLQQLSDGAAQRLVAGHEMFHLVQGLYDPRPAIIQATQVADHGWLDEAVAVWAEELFTDEPDYRPSAWQVQQLQPFVGLQAGAASPTGDSDTALTVRNHGHGMAALIQYITQRWDRTRLSAIYQHLAQNRHPVVAIEEGVGEPLSDWWDAFLRTYVIGEVYGLPWDAVVDNSTAQLNVTSETDTLRTQTYDYPNLSARIFVVDLTDPALEPVAELHLHSGDGSAVISAYSFGGGAEPVLLGHAPFVLAIANLGELAQAARDVLILVTSNHREPPTYDESTRVILSSRIQDHVDLPAFDSGSFSLRFDATWRDALGEIWTTSNHDLRITVGQGQFTGSTFFARWDSTTAAGVRQQGEFSVELDPQSLTLIHWKVFSRTDFSESETFQFFNCSGGGMPLSIQQEDLLEYGLSGTGACGPGPVERVYAIEVTSGAIDRQIVDFSCSEGSFVDVLLEVRDSR